MFDRNPKLKDIMIIGLTSVALIVVNMYTLRTSTLRSYGGMGLYYAALMLYRHFALLKHDGKNGPLEDADERVKSIAHEAGYRTFRLMLGLTFTFAWVPTTYVIPGPALAVVIVGISISLYTLLELDMRLEITPEGAEDKQ